MRPLIRTPVWLAAVVMALWLTPCFAAEPAPTGPATTFIQIADAEQHREHRAMPDFRRYCGFCHGAEGAGDGLNAFNLSIRPTDFTAAAWRQGKSAEGIAQVIRDGGAAAGLSRDMPPWGRTLSPALVRNLADLVLSFGVGAR